MAGNCESLDVARIWIFVIYFIEIAITIVINDDVKRVTERCKRDKKRRTSTLSSPFHSLYNINRSFRVPFYALILSATAFNSSWEGCCLCLKSISLSLEIGRRWMWHGDFQSDDRNGNPFAVDFCFQLTGDFLGKYHQVCQLVIFQIKKVIILFLGTTSVWPSTTGLMSRNA